MTDVQVWWGSAAAARPAHLALLDDVERGRWERYRVESARAQFLVGCAMVRLILARFTGIAPAELIVDRDCRRCGQPHGKPRLVGEDLRFSVSHSGDVVGVAFAPGVDLGLDVERIADRDRADVARVALAPAELDAWQALPQAQRGVAFHTTWSRKESVLKATGDGLSVPMAQLLLSAPHEPPALQAYPGGRRLDATIVDLQPAAGYVGALTVLNSAMNLTSHDAAPILTG